MQFGMIGCLDKKASNFEYFYQITHAAPLPDSISAALIARINFRLLARNNSNPPINSVLAKRPTGLAISSSH
jgi:hypothetical protein